MSVDRVFVFVTENKSINLCTHRRYNKFRDPEIIIIKKAAQVSNKDIYALHTYAF